MQRDVIPIGLRFYSFANDISYLFCNGWLYLLFQLKEQKEFLSKHVVHIGLGTPNRILNLLEIGKYLRQFYWISCTVHV